jgi:hypothetical protein
MFRTYADETGSAPDPNKKHVGMGGLLASAEHWEQFDREWRAICDEEGIILPFHMMDFASRKRHSQFENAKWEDEKHRQRLLGRLLNAIDKAQATPVGAVVNVEDFRSLPEEYQERLGGENREPYYVAFQECTHQLGLENALIRFPPVKVSMTYAKLRKFTGEAEELWNAIRDAPSLYGPLFGSFATGEPVHHTPLQAADIWAYELGHHFEYILPNKKPLRYPFQRLVKMASGRCKYCTFLTYFDKQKMIDLLT